MALRATGHTLPLETGTKRKGEAFRTGASIPSHTRPPQRDSKCRLMPLQKHQRAAGLCEQGREPIRALPLLMDHSQRPLHFTRLLGTPKLTPASPLPPSAGWEFIKDRVFIK